MIEELLNDIDELLMHLEDYTHGKDGHDISAIRARIIIALHNDKSTIETIS